MKRLNLSYNVICLLLLATAMSCTKGQTNDTRNKNLPVLYNVNKVESLKDNSGTKSLIESSSTGNNSLVKACTPLSEGGLGESIGIWSDYELLDNDGNIEEVVSNVFKGTSLIFDSNAGGNPHSSWNYKQEDLFWVIGGRYKFRAYYPQNKTAEYIMSTSSATTFVVEYNTHKMQEDLLVAYNSTDTRTANLNIPVQLNFVHTMSALKFVFQFKDGLIDSDKLTSIWLENSGTNPKKWFADIGLMAYGNNDNPQNIEWSLTHKPAAGHKFSYWQHNGDGIEFKNTSYTGITQQATAYTDPANTAEGNIFANNNGYLLIVPQESHGTLMLCFTTQKGGDIAYRVAIPEITNTTTSDKTFKAGHRYTYTITFNSTDLNLDISIDDWLILNSSHTIEF